MDGESVGVAGVEMGSRYEFAEIGDAYDAIAV